MKHSKEVVIILIVLAGIALFGRYLYDRAHFKVPDASSPEIKAISQNMVMVEGGTFIMGCPGRDRNYCNDGSLPAHEVTVDGFYLSKYDVTQEQWSAVMDKNRSKFKDCPTCPVETVSWDDIKEFISRLNAATGKKYRLPTEAEWEYAAYGGRDAARTLYPGSDSINDVCWYTENSGQKTHPVGLKKPNKLGLYDMSGNVGQWCSDWYETDYYSHSPKANPKGAESGQYRSLRGGDWFARAGGLSSCRIFERMSLPPTDRSFLTGFRLAADK